MFRLPASLFHLYGMSPAVTRDLWASTYAAWSARRKYGGVYEEWRTLLAESQWWGADRLREFQVKRLRELAILAATESAFYRRRFEEYGLDPREIISVSDLKRLPLLDKTTVRSHHGEIATHYAQPRFLTFASSGTTGTSLVVPAYAAAVQQEYAFRWQHHAIAGARHGQRFAQFTGHSIVPISRTRAPYWVRNYAENVLMFSLYHMSDRTLGRYVEAFNRFRPEYVEGYPSGIYVLARYALRTGTTLAPPKAIFTASETLHDEQRSAIEQAFEAPVFQWYGQVEGTANLHECDQHRLHVKEEYGVLELLRDDGSDAGPGESGAVVGTGLGNRAFPLLRYKTTDKMVLATDQTCRCGRGGRIIERILGRDEDFVVTPDGNYVGRLDFVFKPIETVVESQIIQEDERTIVIKVVPLPGFGAADERHIVEQLRTRVGQEMGIEVQVVGSIPRGPGGKLRYVISRVRQP